MTITLAEFKAYARTEAAISDDAWLTAALAAAVAAVNQETQRNFTVAGSASARLYAARPFSSVLRIHDCTTVTAVTEDGTAVASTDYQKEPVNAIDWAGNGRPYEQLRKLGGSVWATDNGEALISVTATWGWTAIPAAVTEAIYILAKDIAQQRDMRAGVAAFGDFGAVRARSNPAVESLIAPFRRVEAFGIA